MKAPAEHPTWEQLLQSAVNEPGRILEAYTAFHGYSLGNQLLALFQCAARGIAAGPLATYPAWQAKGRQVRKGEKAITLCMPVTCKRGAENEGDEEGVFTRFIYRPNWFVLAQTDGEALPVAKSPAFDVDAALAGLEIARVDFASTDGNCQGYASGRSIAINPVAQLPMKTTFHEIAHVLLGHTETGAMNDGERLPRDLREAEAEAVALLCCESLGLPGADYARGYIQKWLAGQAIPERSAQRIFKAADQILKAGVRL